MLFSQILVHSLDLNEDVIQVYECANGRTTINNIHRYVLIYVYKRNQEYKQDLIAEQRYRTILAHSKGQTQSEIGTELGKRQRHKENSTNLLKDEYTQTIQRLRTDRCSIEIKHDHFGILSAVTASRGTY